MNNNVGQPPPHGDGQAHLIPDSPNNEEGVAEQDDDEEVPDFFAAPSFRGRFLGREPEFGGAASSAAAVSAAAATERRRLRGGSSGTTKSRDTHSLCWLDVHSTRHIMRLLSGSGE